MTTTAKEGAEFRLDPSPYGNPERRAAGMALIDAATTLPEALSLLMAWREEYAASSMTDQDDLWLESKLEAKVAVLRFSSMTNEQIRTETLTGELVAEVCAKARADAEGAGRDHTALEELVAAFRTRYKPPVMPSSPFMRAETEIVEFLMKARERDWYGQSLEELRVARGVVVHKGGSRKGQS
jgi:methane monooxygenase component A gamma chain